MIVIYLLYLYIVLGIVIALWFAFFKVHHLDHNAEGTSLLFRIMILPGSIILWPYIIYKNYKHDRKV
jgi:hypothetical protein